MRDEPSAADLLVELLRTNRGYRRQWEIHAQRRRSESVSRAAVAKVLALFLWDSGERSDADTALARRLRDRVRRAMTGESLTGETLDWFVQAFAMSADDEQQLWLALAGGGSAAEGIADTIAHPRTLAKPQLHRTVSLFERYQVDHRGVLTERHTMQVIRAVEARVTGYMFNHEPAAREITVLSGGAAGPRYEHGNGLVSDEIIFDTPLVPPLAASLEYETHYPALFAPTELRRAVLARCENVDIAVHFETPPDVVEFCVWDDHLDGYPLRTVSVVPDQRGYAHRFIAFARQTVIGFRWF